MFEIINGLTPVYLQNFFSILSTECNFRDSEAKLELGMPRTNYGKRAFSFGGALLWNNFPLSLRKSDSLGYFKREIDQLYGISCSVVTKDFTLFYKVLVNKISCYMIKLTNVAD